MGPLENRFWYNGEEPIVGAMDAPPDGAFRGCDVRAIDTGDAIDAVCHGAYDAVYAHDASDGIIAAVMACGIPVYTDVRHEGMWECDRGGSRLYTAGGTRKFVWRERAKRLLDVVVAVIGAVVVTVILPFVYVAVFAESGRPVFYSQERVGYNGRRFMMHKFRTMYNASDLPDDTVLVNETNDMMFKMENDPRVTRVGRVLRRLSIDEMPQFLNILLGQMSVVGTRPPTASEFERYDVPAYKGRLAAKPGLTGAWQISGRHGICSFDEVVRLDRSWIEDDGVPNYLRILAATITHGEWKHGV